MAERSLVEGLNLLIPRGAPNNRFSRRPVEVGDVAGRDFDKAVQAAAAIEVGRAVAAV